LNFKNLLLGFRKALLEAEAATRDQHRRQLARYLDEDDEPLSMTIRMPPTAGAEGDEPGREIVVPLYALMPNRSLQLKDAELELEVDVKGLAAADGKALEGADLDLSQLSVRLADTPAGTGANARLRVRFEAARLSEEELPRVELQVVEAAAE
jgi:hypothetical protein